MRCGLLGRTLSHSHSPLLHSLLGSYDYALFEIPPEQVEDFLRSGPWDGLNVTIPYKRAVIPYCAELSAAVPSVAEVLATVTVSTLSLREAEALRRQTPGALSSVSTWLGTSSPS